MKKALVIAATVILTASLAACSGGASPVAGKWQSAITPEITIVFKDDGALEEYWHSTLAATYSYKQRGTQLAVDQVVEQYTLTIDGDALVYGGETLYTRIGEGGVEER